MGFIVDDVAHQPRKAALFLEVYQIVNAKVCKDVTLLSDAKRNNIAFRSQDVNLNNEQLRPVFDAQRTALTGLPRSSAETLRF